MACLFLLSLRPRDNSIADIAYGPMFAIDAWAASSSRHPNYFGEALLWWGAFLVALSTPHGVRAIVSPVTMSGLLRFVSGIPMLEARMARSPAFRAY